MSTRTIIEINHDYLHQLEDADTLLTVIEELAGSRVAQALNTGRPVYLTPGIRVLGQRHHSEPEWVQGNGKPKA